MNSEESGIGYRKIHLILTFFAWILHSTPYFFITLFPTAFFLRSRMTGRYLLSFCKNLFFGFCSHLPLSAANAATFPDKRGQLTINILSVFTHICAYYQPID